MNNPVENLPPTTELEYVGFWARVGAALIDSLLMMAVVGPLLSMIYGMGYWANTDLLKGPADFMLSWALPAVAVIVFWVTKQATPGKMLISARIVDAQTGNPASAGQLIGRYLGYFVSMFPFFLGILWVAFDAKKQGWHDKLAGTVVVRPKNRSPEPVSFPKQ